MVNMTNDLILGDNLVIPAQTRQERLYDYACEYKLLAERLDETKERIDYIKALMLSELPEEFGEWEVPLQEGGRVKIATPEKWEWDKKILSEMLGDGQLPDCVSQNFTVSKTRYEAASDEVKSQLVEALTIKRGTTLVKVLKT
jgi:hypothetical protein